MLSCIEFFFVYSAGFIFVNSVFHLDFSYSLDHFIFPFPSQPTPIMLAKSYPFFKQGSDTTLQYLSSTIPTILTKIRLISESILVGNH